MNGEFKTCERHGFYPANSTCPECASIPAAERFTCGWVYDDDCDRWDTICGHSFYFTHGGPIDNEFKACPFCTRLIEITPNETPAQ